MLQQFALSHYLRQNLSQFVHTPKYMDNNQDHVFLDYTQTPAKPMHEDYVFLYNRPQQSGGSGKFIRICINSILSCILNWLLSIYY